MSGGGSGGGSSRTIAVKSGSRSSAKRLKSAVIGAWAAGLSAKSRSSAFVVLVRDRERLVEDRDPFLDLVARNRERRADHDHVPVRHQVEAAPERRLRESRDRGEGLAGGVEGDERLARRAFLDQLEAPEAAEPAHLADRPMLVLQRAKLLREDAAHLGRVLDDAFLLERLDRGDRRRAGQRMARVGEPAREVLVA